MRKIAIIMMMFLMSVSLVNATGFDETLRNLKAVGDKTDYNTNVTETTFSETLGRIVQTIIGLLGIVFTILIIYGGIIWMTAGGDEQNVTKAKGIIKNGIIGLVIVLLSLVISEFILEILKQPTTTQPKTP